MEGNEKGRIEAILFVSGDAVEIRDLARAMNLDEKTVRKILKELESEYDYQQRGFLLKRFGDRVQLATRPLYAEDVVRLLQPVQKQSLTARGLIQEVGRRETVGRPILFGTTDEFLSRFGIESLEQLPPLPEAEEPENEGEHEELIP